MPVKRLLSKVQTRLESEICLRAPRRELEFDLDYPIVTFSFDDFPATAYRTGGRILEQSGMRGTYYTALGLKGKVTEVGEQFSLDDLHDVHTAGHELACHTYSHLTCSELSPAQYLEDIERNEREFSAELPDVKLEAFSYPKGVVRPLHHRRVSDRFDCLRTVVAGVNRGRINVNHLLAVRLYESRIDLAEVDRLIAGLEREPGWLIFYTHDVDQNPSEYGSTPNLFESTVAKVANSSAQVLTVSDALRRIRSAACPTPGH